LEIAASNLALTILSLSFHTMVHASKPAFFVLWSIVLGLEKPSMEIFIIVAAVTFGVVLLSVGETTIHPIAVAVDTNDTTKTLSSPSIRDPGFSADGFALILFSCFISGLRWGIIQLMMQQVNVSSDSNEKLSPLTVLFYTSPFSALSLFPFFLFRELGSFTQFAAAHDDAAGELFGFGMLISFWSLALIMTEFYFVRQTSAVFFAFATILKELFMVSLALILNGDVLPPLNAIGFLMCLIGIIAYQRFKLFSSTNQQGGH
jgi:solute carrier family 35 protein C2